MRWLRLFAIAAGMAWLACQSMEISSDFRRNFRFSSVETYAWLPNPPGHAGDPVLHNDLVDGRVRDAVDLELHAMGYRKVDVGDADIHVTYYVGLDTRVTWQMVSRAYHYRGGFFDHHRTDTRLREQERGTLLIDMLDPARRQLVWRGTAQARIDRRADADTREERIFDAVARILEQFPPAGPEFRPGARQADVATTGE